MGVFGRAQVFVIDGNLATNLCPCGWVGDPAGRCRCTIDQIHRYRSKISGPFLDRIDIQVEVSAVPRRYLRADKNKGEPSSAVRRRVFRARKLQMKRAGSLNHQLAGESLERVCSVDRGTQNLLDAAMDKLGLSARAYHRILKVARTIADLADESALTAAHVGEAIGYRILDRTQNCWD